MRCCGLPLTRHTHAGQLCTPRCHLLTRMGCPPRSASAATASTARPLPLHPLPLASGPPWIAASRWYQATCSCKQQWWCLLVHPVRSVLTTCLLVARISYVETYAWAHLDPAEIVATKQAAIAAGSAPGVKPVGATAGAGGGAGGGAGAAVAAQLGKSAVGLPPLASAPVCCPSRVVFSPPSCHVLHASCCCCFLRACHEQTAAQIEIPEDPDADCDGNVLREYVSPSILSEWQSTGAWPSTRGPCLLCKRAAELEELTRRIKVTMVVDRLPHRAVWKVCSHTWCNAVAAGVRGLCLLADSQAAAVTH